MNHEQEQAVSGELDLPGSQPPSRSIPSFGGGGGDDGVPGASGDLGGPSGDCACIHCAIAALYHLEARRIERLQACAPELAPWPPPDELAAFEFEQARTPPGIIDLHVFHIGPGDPGPAVYDVLPDGWG